MAWWRRPLKTALAMTLRCRPGDLAIVIEGESCGAVVDVLRRTYDHPTTGAPSWECRIRADMLITHVNMRTGRAMGRRIAPAGETACFVDVCLQPIRPPKPPRAIPAPPIELETTP